MSNTLTSPKRPSIGLFFAAIAGALASGHCREAKQIRANLQAAGVKTGNKKTSSGKNQRQIRKNRRRRFAAGDRRAFAS